ncbi:MAG: alpha/beta hydrolase [Acidobacteria bacterium]|nr:MAG: alpha/beta hydrolase [Acidobacteriota bacterium]
MTPFLSLLLALFQLMTSSDLDHLVAPPPEARISYGDHALQFGELRLPEGPGPHPVAIVIHGGCWLGEFDLTHIGTLAEALNEEGIAAWVIEYRRVGNPGGGWPGTFEDVARGADHLRKVAEEYPLDLDRVIAVGHSAGGHLALWLAARRRLSKDQPLYQSDPITLRGVLALAPAPDLAFLHQEQVCGHVINGLMGGSPKTFPERYAAASPVELVPMTPQLVVIGQHDSHWAPVGRRYIKAAKSQGADIKVIEAPESGHFEMIDPSTSTWPLIRNAAAALVK